MRETKTNKNTNSAVAFHPACFILLMTVFGLSAAVLIATDGLLVYSTDDALAYLATAERLAAGQWMSSLSHPTFEGKSIIWSAFLLPLVNTQLGILMPLILNTVFGLLVLAILQQILSTNLIHLKQRWQRAASLLLGLSFFVATNFLSIIFAGDEQMMLIFSCALIMLGVIHHQTYQTIFPLWLIFVVLMPFIHTNGIVMSIGAVLYLLLRGLWKESSALAVISIGLYISVVVMTEGIYPDVSQNTLLNYSHTFTKLTSLANKAPTLINSLRYSDYFVVITTLCSAISIVLPLGAAMRSLCLTFCGVVVLHLLFNNSTEAVLFDHWMWVVATQMMLVLIPAWCSMLTITTKLAHWIATPIILVGSWNPAFIEHVVLSFKESERLYLTNYQMRRFVTLYYRAPVATDVGGWLSWKNNYPVLILNSKLLGTNETVNKENDCILTKTLVTQHHTQLAIMSDPINSETYHLPREWREIATLETTKHATPVKIYLTNPAMEDHARHALNQFKSSLPDRTTLHLFSPMRLNSHGC